MSEKEWFAGDRAGRTMEIVSLRDPSRGDATAAYVMVDDVFECHSLEDVVREPATGRPADLKALEHWVLSWKVPGATAVLTGRYLVRLEKSPKFGDDTITICNIPGWSYVRSHSGLEPGHTDGCPLLGDEQYESDQGPRIRSGTTRPAVARLKAKIKAAIARGDAVWWSFMLNPNAR